MRFEKRDKMKEEDADGESRFVAQPVQPVRKEPVMKGSAKFDDFPQFQGFDKSLKSLRCPKHVLNKSNSIPERIRTKSHKQVTCESPPHPSLLKGV